MDFHWNNDQLAEEIPLHSDGTPDDKNTIHWIYEPGSFTPLARYEKGRLHYAVTDTVGRIQELLTEEGTIVWKGKPQLWGKEEGRNQEDAPSCRLRFPGQYEDDESGLFYNRYRYYDGDTGQYVSPDPIGLVGGTNPYSYVVNPLKWIDPLGLAGKDCCEQIKNSAGEDVFRRYVNNQDNLLAEAEKAAGGNLDSFTNYKENWYSSADGNRRIEWNPYGHANTNEGPHVTIRDFDGKRHSVTDKIFIEGRDKYDGKF
ncbi:RHS repeat-associated core domain-containing protein [Hafnia alvei]|uniref:RHS repeat-associated core domain-containing protein n=1 Tax=Hafnia alvei TaxID=569 RepID=UPI00069B6153|nr:RHS repeat-associated core domain-containing protein [Hafnia alvei]